MLVERQPMMLLGASCYMYQVTGSRERVKRFFIASWRLRWMLRHKSHCLFIDILLYLEVLKLCTTFSSGSCKLYDYGISSSGAWYSSLLSEGQVLTGSMREFTLLEIQYFTLLM